MLSLIDILRSWVLPLVDTPKNLSDIHLSCHRSHHHHYTTSLLVYIWSLCTGIPPLCNLQFYQLRYNTYVGSIKRWRGVNRYWMNKTWLFRKFSFVSTKNLWFVLFFFNSRYSESRDEQRILFYTCFKFLSFTISLEFLGIAVDQFAGC